MFVPLNANELVLPDPFSEEGGASRAHAPAYHQQQNRPISHTENVRNYQAVDFTLLSYAISNYHIPIYDDSGSTCRQHYWKQAEIIVALAKLALPLALQGSSHRKAFKKKWHAYIVWSWSPCTKHWNWSLSELILRKSSIEMTSVC